MTNNDLYNEEQILLQVADNLRLERLRKRFSQEKLADMVGISAKYLNMIENRRSNPSIAVVIRICIALDIDLNTVWTK